MDGKDDKEVQKLMIELQEALIQSNYHCAVITKQVRILVPQVASELSLN